MNINHLLGTPVLSYLIATSDVDHEVYDDKPKDFRQHFIKDKSKVFDEIMADRGIIPEGHIVEWYSSSL
jgi:hypothetical protein